MQFTYQILSELKRYFGPKPQVYKKLPGTGSFEEFAEVWITNQDGISYDYYKLVKGKWIKTGSSITNNEKIATGTSGGSATAAVDSFNSRTGAVSSQAGDYNATQIGLGNVTNDAQLKRAAGDFNSFAEKTSLVDGDVFLIEDSETTPTAFVKKKTLWSTIRTAIGNYFNDRFIPPGGTTGQALTKTSNADYDTGWATISVGGDGALALTSALYGGFKSTIDITGALTLSASVHA